MRRWWKKITWNTNNSKENKIGKVFESVMIWINKDVFIRKILFLINDAKKACSL